MSLLTCGQAGWGGRGTGWRGVYGYCWCCRFTSVGISRGKERQGPGRQRLAPLQQLLLLLLAEARWYLSGQVALLLLLLEQSLRLASGGGALPISTALGYGWDGTGVGGEKRRGGVELGRVWHCGSGAGKVWVRRRECKYRMSGLKER